jgi:hypothetical protein
VYIHIYIHIYMSIRWYNFNDAYVSETTAAHSVSELSYVLFYKRRTGNLLWAGQVPLEEGLPDEDD